MSDAIGYKAVIACMPSDASRSQTGCGIVSYIVRATAMLELSMSLNLDVANASTHHLVKTTSILSAAKSAMCNSETRLQKQLSAC